MCTRRLWSWILHQRYYTVYIYKYIVHCPPQKQRISDCWCCGDLSGYVGDIYILRSSTSDTLVWNSVTRWRNVARRKPRKACSAVWSVRPWGTTALRRWRKGPWPTPKCSRSCLTPLCAWSLSKCRRIHKRSASKSVYLSSASRAFRFSTEQHCYWICVLLWSSATWRIQLLPRRFRSSLMSDS